MYVIRNDQRIPHIGVYKPWYILRIKMKKGKDKEIIKASKGMSENHRLKHGKYAFPEGTQKPTERSYR